MNNLISIVIINYNKSLYLAECLKSVLVQYDEISEIIIVDDCSIDNSIEIINSYCNNYSKIKLFCNESNQGPSYSRDKGIRNTTSDFFITLDSDDYILPQYVKNVKKHFHKNKNAIVVCAFSVINESNQVVKTIDVTNFCKQSPYKQVESLVSRKYGIPGNQIAISKENYLAAGGLNTTLRLYEDWDFQIRLTNLELPWEAIETIGFHYRKAGDGLSSLSQLKHLKYKKYVLLQNFKITQFKGAFLIGIFKLLWNKSWKYMLGKQDKYGFN